MLRTLSSNHFAVRIGLCGVLAGGALFAADFWTAKPYTEWSEKEVQKLISSSPWAHVVSISLGEGMTGARGGRGRGAQTGEPTGAAGQMEGLGNSPGGAGGAGGRRGGPGDDPGGAVGSTPTMQALIRWQSALPVKQAVLKAKYGKEVATSDDAKKFLDQEEPNYVVMFNFPNPRMMGGGMGPGGVGKGQAEAIKTAAMLKRKGKEPIFPVDVKIVPREGAGVDIFMMFPKTDPIVLDDKEVEFYFKGQIGPEVRQRFKLKEMMIGDKLAL